MSVVTATPPAGIANANQSDSRKVLLSVRDVLKVYGSREAVTRALDDVSFDICEGEFVGVMGPSGSGKSTLLNCISTIDTVTSGNIILNGLDITQLRSRQLSKFRRDDLGFIFQDANLIDTLTGFENIALALTIKGEKADAVRTKVERTATLLGVTDVLQKYPRQMSGGQRQRVAAARAIVADPKLVLADELHRRARFAQRRRPPRDARGAEHEAARHHHDGHTRRGCSIVCRPHPVHQGRQAVQRAASRR